MKITIEDRGTSSLAGRLRERLERAGSLRCEEHGQRVVAVTINARENGWFDCTWITCCDHLVQRARAIVKDRC
jgi:enoyl reductase-like protein